MAYQSQTEQIDQAGLFFHALDTRPDLAAQLAQVGHGPQRIEQGRAAYLRASQARAQRITAYAQQIEASRRCTDLRAQAEAQVRQLDRLLRVLYRRSPSTIDCMGLGGKPSMATPRKRPDGTTAAQRPSRSTANFLRSAPALYAAIADTPEVGAALAQVGYPPQRLADERATVEQWAAAMTARASARSAAQIATEAQHEALAALAAWMRDTHGMLRITLAHAPADLLALGIRPAR